MNYLTLAAAAVFFLLHLVSETIASFIKYNFSSLGRHMLGISLSNIFAIASRGFVALYGISIAVVIEKSFADIQIYGYVFSFVLILGAGFSLLLANLKLSKAAFEDLIQGKLPLHQRFRTAFSANDTTCLIPVRGVAALMLGTQFIAVVIAYGLCFYLPQNRLLIISFVPLVSMMGTLVTILWVEPRLASMIDADNVTGYSAAREFLRARALSFSFCAALLLMMPWLMSGSGS
ncbi:MAG: hypothetical protein WBH99_11560 [Azovibrio sp.]|uniref:hypothetical protein n=1 Tax=Azovibrio sp. TaxID=1872673 RepID=UPI003C78DB4C